MVNTGREPLPLHELISQILTPESSVQKGRGLLSGLGSMQALNQRLVNQPLPDFINASLRGISQVIFVNNPLSGLLILTAMFIQSPWLGSMTLLGSAAATLTAILGKSNRGAIQNGIYGLNGTLIGAALAFFGAFGNGAWNPVWAIANIILSGLTVVVMETVGTWFATRFRVAPLGIPFNGVILTFLLLLVFLPQSLFDLGPPPPLFSDGEIDRFRLLQSLPTSLGQIFFVDQVISVLLVVLGIAISTPIGALVGLLGCGMYLLAGLLLGIKPDQLYTGFWGYNAALTATAIGGVFYTPNRLSITIGAISAFFASIVSILLSPLFSLLKLPVLSVPFAIVTIGCLLVLQRSLPSLVPVVLHTVASPEEHRQRFLIAKEIITSFRQQLRAALKGEKCNILFDQASEAIKGDLRYIFDAMDCDRSGFLSKEELADHLQQAGKLVSDQELTYLFKSIDRDNNGTIDFEELGELMLRHRRLMSKYTEFVTYFLPIDANEDDAIGIDEMNIAIASVGELPLSKDEIIYLQEKTEGQPLSWNQFIELLLVL
ncbi:MULTISPECIES: urea transporter [unclassified Nodularia (in: cyanobacteria)]|uniref:urea transporter n=1 Tax=unclassified Nodularia (in: cyanobacteria) TaxID=2656917 RepID=UPI00187E2B15|nr:MULTISPECIES: urea transporter [unclassified Nodularia (in: cyanobacteria)]MBE9201783.1 urea transporter [Nodularia sp. LEGE 06071]MCC2694445.1 urea transporter [Nodularia sp. LEGE 04288]